MTALDAIRRAEGRIAGRFKGKLVINPDLDRTLVSFQANRRRNGYRWFKYKEGFSAALVRYLLEKLGIARGRLIDPFAGSGAALFGAAEAGSAAFGIELLPIGREIIEARKLAADASDLAPVLEKWERHKPWRAARQAVPFRHLRITEGAFPPETDESIGKYVASLEGVEPRKRSLLRFAAMCVLEDVSYTRKDGQYLRWDHRSGRRQGAKRFDKGPVPSFDDAVTAKLRQIREDIGNDPKGRVGGLAKGTVDVVTGSCLDVLPQTEAASFDCLITSPPYCNRYDYTRTYALELAFLGTTEDQLRQLRQAMVACTVENRDKERLGRPCEGELVRRAAEAFDRQELLHHVLAYLEQRRAAGLLNNTGIPRMVRNYFREMALVIFECARVLKPGAPMVMVNDNVRYEGARVPVDLILSDIARQAGFEVETIWVLPVGKGNSSQQMGRHGRDELRKCVYVWRAPQPSPGGRSNPPRGGRVAIRPGAG
jgi:DNA modification methylase